MNLPAEVLWSFQAPSTCDHPPVRDPEGNIYVRAQEESVFALDEKGNTLWNVKNNMSFGDPPNVDKNGNVYYIDSYGIIEGITFKSLTPQGEKRWEYSQKISGGFESYTDQGRPRTITDDSTSSVLGRFQNTLYNIDLDSGKLNWTPQMKGIRAAGTDGKELWFTQGEFTGSPLPGPDNTLYVKKKEGKERYTICALDSTTGAFKWTSPVPAAQDLQTLVDPDGNLIVKMDVPGKPVKTTAGKKRWSRSLTEDPISKICCIQPDGRAKWIMEPG